MVTIDELIVSETLDRVGKKLDEKDKEMMYLAIRRMMHNYLQNPQMRAEIDRYIEEKTSKYKNHEDRTLELLKYNVDNITK